MGVRRGSRDRVQNEPYTPEDKFGQDRDHEWEEHMTYMAMEQMEDDIGLWALLAVRKPTSKLSR